MPVGVAAGIYLEEYARKNWLTDVIEINVTNLAGVPSIIYGLLALGLFVQTLRLGQTILVAGMTLALAHPADHHRRHPRGLRSIPLEIREAAYRLGADKWQAVWMYLLPAARPGILTGAIVGMSRAIGETAPIITIGALTFIAFLPPPPIQADFPFVNFEWLSSPFTVLPIQMFNWISRPQAGFHIAAAATGVILLAMTLLMNGFAIYIRYRIRRTDQRDARSFRMDMATRWRHHAAVTATMAKRRCVRACRGPELLLRREAGARQRELSRPRPQGDGADRTLRLRQEHVVACVQPHARSLSRQPLRGRDHALPGRDQHRLARGRSDAGAAEDRHGVPEAEPVSEIHL